MNKALVAGHICLDITPRFPSRLGDTAPLEGGKLYVVNAADMHTGGAVANTGLAMSFFGSDVELLCKVGEDRFGDIVRSALREIGARCRVKTDEAQSTSYSIAIAKPGIDRIFLHCPGVNDTFSCADVTKEDLAGKQLFHFGYPTLMRRMYADNGRELTSLFRMVYQSGVVTSLDLAVPDPQSDAGKADWETILGNTLPYVDFFVPSFEELCYMLDRDRYNALCGGGDMCSKISLSDLQTLADKVLRLGASCVFIKAGACGIYYASAPQCRFVGMLSLEGDEWLGKQGFVPSYRAARVCSGTGAGDTAIAAFLSAVLRGYGLFRCVRLAAAAGAVCVEAYDALSALQPLDSLEKRIDSGWEQQHLMEE